MPSTASSYSSSEQEAAKTKPDEPVNEYEDAERNYQLKSFKFWSIILGAISAVFLVGLDRIIIAAAIPRITDEFDSIQDIGWYGSAYMLTAACFMPISGRVYQLYSTKWVFLGAIVVFEVGSALCGAAPNSVAFIIGRAIAGLGSSFIFSGGNMLTLPLIPLRKRPVFSSLFGLAFGISSVLGPFLGGVFTDHLTWRWCFYINLPIGAFTLLTTYLFVHVDSPRREKLSVLGQIKRLDPVGVLLFVPSVICLILALQWGGTTYPWSAPRIVGLLVTFAVLFTAFMAYEAYTPETAMAPLRVVGNRSIAGAMFFMCLLSGGLMSVIYYLTIWFQAVKNDSAMRSGVNTIPLLASFILFGILVAVLTQKIGYYNPSLLIAAVPCSIGSGLLSTLSPSSSTSAWIGFQILYGIGIGCGFQTSVLPAQNVLPRADVPLGLGIMFFMQQLGGTVFLAASQSLFSSRLVGRLSGLAGFNPQLVLSTGATELRKLVPQDQLEVVVEAYNYALTRVFILTAALSAVAIFGALLIKWKKLQGKEGGKGNGEVKEDPESAKTGFEEKE